MNACAATYNIARRISVNNGVILGFTKYSGSCCLLLHQFFQIKMSIYEEIEIEDMTYNDEERMYYYPCPCGDKFRISLEDLWDGEDIAKCPSCTLRILVIYEEEDLPPLPDESDGEEEEKEEEAALTDKLQAVKIVS